MTRRIATFVAAFIVWLLLAYSGPDTGWERESLVIGVFASLIVAAIFPATIALRPAKLFNPVRWFWFLVYIPVLIYYCIVASLHVMYLVLHPDLPIKPGVVKVKTRLRRKAARTILANSITLTPGTLTLDITEDGYLYVHWLVVESSDMRAATRAIVGRYEGLIEKIME